MLTAVDRSALAAYCNAWARLKEAEQMLQRPDTKPVIRNAHGTGWTRNPWVVISERAMEQVVRFSSEFGLTPAARTRIQVPKGETEDDWPELD